MEEARYKGCAIEIEVDDSAMDPLREYDTAGVFACWHRRYNIGNMADTWKTPEDFHEWYRAHKKDVVVMLPLYLYDHGMLALRAGGRVDGEDEGSNPFIGRAQHAEWDSGQVGYALLTRDVVKREWAGKDGRITRKVREAAERYLRGQIAVYGAWLSDDVYGWVTRDQEGEVIDSCWGYYGYDENKEHMIQEGKDSIREYWRREIERHRKQRAVSAA